MFCKGLYLCVLLRTGVCFSSRWIGYQVLLPSKMRGKNHRRRKLSRCESYVFYCFLRLRIYFDKVVEEMGDVFLGCMKYRRWSRIWSSAVSHRLHIFRMFPWVDLYWWLLLRSRSFMVLAALWLYLIVFPDACQMIIYARCGCQSHPLCQQAGLWRCPMMTMMSYPCFSEAASCV